MSVRKEIYNRFSEKLEELGVFRWIDLYKGQLKNNGDSYSEGFPCAFISTGKITYRDMTANAQEGKATIDVYVFFNDGGDTFVDAEDRDVSLEILDILDDTVNALQWLSGEYFTDISQSGEEDLTQQYGRPAFLLSFDIVIYNQLKYPDYVFG